MPGRRTLPPVCHPSALVAQQHPAAPSTAAGSLSTAAPVTNLTTVPPDGALIAQSSAGATHAADGERHVALSPNQGRDNQPLPRLSYLASPYRYRVHSIAAPRHHTVLPYARHQQHVEQADPQRGATVSTIGPIRTTPGTRHAGSASRIESTAGRVAPSAPRPVLLFAPVAGAQMLRRQLENRLYRIPLAPLRTDNCFARYPVRFPDGQVGINVSAFVNLATYTKAGLAHPEAERAVGARADLDGLIKGTRILCTSSAVSPRRRLRKRESAPGVLP
ncbi:hypothetical protein BD414DRAFT_218834 [Trametes punicea]|nr:hypothetical protein BD414DRAFT_218834 [Trametes punicea]